MEKASTSLADSIPAILSFKRSSSKTQHFVSFRTKNRLKTHREAWKLYPNTSQTHKTQTESKNCTNPSYKPLSWLNIVRKQGNVQQKFREGFGRMYDDSEADPWRKRALQQFEGVPFVFGCF